MDVFVLNLIPVFCFGLLFYKAEKREDSFLSLSTSKSLKGFAALGVILHHITQLNTNYSQIWKGPINLWNEMGILFTGIFFFLSGYGLWMSYHSKPNYLNGFLKKRLPSVLIPFLVSNVIYTLILGIPFGIFQNPLLILTSLIGITLVNTNTWFLVEILILYISFYYFYKNFSEKNAQKGIVFTVFLIVGIGIFAGHDSTMYGNWFRGEWWYNTTFVFLFGFFFAKYKARILEKVQHFSHIFLFSFVLWAIWMALDVFMLTHVGYYYEPTFFIGFICRFVTCVVQTINSALFMWLFVLASRKWKMENTILYFIGDISLELYVIHNLFRLAGVYVLGLRDTLLYVFVIGISVLLAYPLHLLDQKIILKIK